MDHGHRTMALIIDLYRITLHLPNQPAVYLYRVNLISNLIGGCHKLSQPLKR